MEKLNKLVVLKSACKENAKELLKNAKKELIKNKVFE